MNVKDIKNPLFLNALSNDELVNLAKDIREFIVDKVSVTGGHLAGNLGIVDLVIALHKHYGENYKFIFDVGHQCYCHKILTGRANQFDNLRQMDGLNGFPLRSESEYDIWDVAHASTSLAAQAGFIEAGKNVISIIGDGALTGGESLEGLGYLASLKMKSIIIINDNNYSISKNEGSVRDALDNCKVNPNSNIFTTLGFNYVGPIDGHNYESMFNAFTKVDSLDGPTIIHVLTKKGKGFKYTENDEVGIWHCLGPFNKETGEIKNNENYMGLNEAASRYLIKFEKEYKNTRVVIPAMTASSNMVILKDALKEKYIDTGITEQFATTFASSLAMNGFYTVLAIYSSFAQRAYDQIHQDICLQNTHTVILVDKCGFVPGNGKTHQGMYDISYLSTIPNLKILAPKDANELSMMFEYALLNYDKPIAIHIANEPVKRINSFKATGNKINLDWEFINKFDNPDAFVITYSTLVDYVKDELYKNNIEVINAKTIKPLDEKMLNKLASFNKNIYVYEEAPSETSLYSSISTYYSLNKINTKLYSLGYPLDYIDIGNYEQIRKKYNLDKESVVKRIKESL